ncbi:MAG: hypothetical protein V4631_20955 [Pseudomonadota bacterium]
MSKNQFYLQDSRSYVGNDLLFWSKDGKGYTTDVSKAQVYSREQALAQHQSRETDIPWPKAYIDAKTRPAVRQARRRAGRYRHRADQATDAETGSRELYRLRQVHPCY